MEGQLDKLSLFESKEKEEDANVSALQVRSLRSHRDEILCVDSSPVKGGAPIAATGSADGSVRVWDLRQNRAVRSIKSDVLEGEPVNAVKFQPLNPNTLFAASGSTISSFDLRTDRVLLSSFSLRSTYNEDEVNQISFSSDGKLLAACDDAGTVAISNPSDGSRVRLLRRRHENICMSVAFHPRAKHIVVSGGLDCKIVTWDHSRGKPTNEMKITKHETEDAPNQMTNPPLVHSLSFLPNTGSCMAVGLGDGSVTLYESRSWRELNRVQVHRAAVGQALFWGEAEERVDLESDTAGGQTATLVTQSNDQTIGMWKVPLDIARSASSSGNSRGGGKGKGVVSRLECPLGLGAIHRFQHADKINWIAPVDQATMPGTLLVADTTEQLKVYTGLDR